MGKKAALLSVGCKVSTYETAAMANLLQEGGYEIVDFSDVCDVYVINTCTVTNVGDKKSRQQIRRAKKINPNAVVVVAGCLAQVRADEVSKISEVDIILGLGNHEKICSFIDEFTESRTTLNAVKPIENVREFTEIDGSKQNTRTRAYIKIEDGCNNFCTYCIIPYARGRVRSRDLDSVSEEAKKLCESGIKEIVLTGIHVGSYGNDLGDVSLIDCIKKVHETKGLERLRLSSIEPMTMTEEFVYELSKLDKFCDHFHLSLQSGCDKTLLAMNRRYTAGEYAGAVQRIRKYFPNSAIWTDIIVGFPNESESDFLESYEFVKSAKLTNLHVFAYSPKVGTKAFEMDHQISSEVKKERATKMIALANELYLDYLKRQIGKDFAVYFEQESDKKGAYKGHTKNNILVEVKADIELTNKIYNVRILEANKELCLGEIVN